MKYEAKDYYDGLKRQRDVILLYYVLELSDLEIGGKLNWPSPFFSVKSPPVD